jgi:hypothetical protein
MLDQKDASVFYRIGNITLSEYAYIELENIDALEKHRIITELNHACRELLLHNCAPETIDVVLKMQNIISHLN